MESTIQRFPRLQPSGVNAATISKLAWTTPSLHVRIKKKKRSLTKFIFNIPMSPEFRKCCPELHELITGPQIRMFEIALEKGYERSRSNKRPLQQEIASRLRKAFNVGVRAWLREMWKFNRPYAYRIAIELSKFEKLAAIRPGPNADVGLAIWAFKTKCLIKRELTDLRQSLKGEARSIKNSELERVLINRMPDNHFRTALKHLLRKETGFNALSFFVQGGHASQSTPNRLAEELVGKVIKRRRHYNAKISLPKYLRTGHTELALIQQQA